MIKNTCQNNTASLFKKKKEMELVSTDKYLYKETPSVPGKKSIAENTIILLITFAFFGAFFCSFAITGYKMPPMINETTLFYPFWQVRDNYSMFNLTIGPISKFYKEIKVYGCFVREVIEPDETFNITIYGNTTYFKGEKVVDVKQREPFNFSAFYPGKKMTSTPFLLYEHLPGDFDYVDVKIYCTNGLKYITGLTVNYSFINPNTERFLDSARTFISLSAVYGTFGRLADIVKPRNFTFMSLLSVVLGFAACFAANPLNVISHSFGRCFDIVFQVLFFLVYRVFVFCTLNKFVFNDEDKEKKLTIFIIIVCGTLAVLEFSTQFDSTSFSFMTLSNAFGEASQMETCAYWFNQIIAFLALIESIYTLCKAEASKLNEVISYTSFIITGALITIVSKGILEKMEAFHMMCFPSLMYISGHVLISSIFLLFGSTIENEYKVLGEEGGEKDGNFNAEDIMIGIEGSDELSGASASSSN